MVVFLILRWLSSMQVFKSLCALELSGSYYGMSGLFGCCLFRCGLLQLFSFLAQDFVVHTLNLWQWNLGFVDFASCIV
ncbi:unnamed protein product [Rhizophagus irregularis]|uniref:Uncharacterized protein n=1 Tax=Rhizophagus irregularis TaxID=588596 RepID=A0A916E2C0_9GLOM|nr:unnamed protein product [Rhizophagus irregularis]